MSRCKEVVLAVGGLKESGFFSIIRRLLAAMLSMFRPYISRISQL
jgi:hypothetical protein